ncbi:MAG: hypothetical protein JO257_07910 [Deltaproteobacteria bacterium]|nr:hypothetical protein [Deltaproteobacteria bacterium]
MTEKKPNVLTATSIVGNWRLAAPLGQGGQGEVWSVKPAKTKRAPLRALKACITEDAQARDHFVREVTTLRK